MARSTSLNGIRAGLADLLVTLVFAVVGRASHHEAFSVAGLAITWWPFAIGAAAGWLICYRLRIRVGSIGGGLITTALAVVLGMLLRLLSGQGVQVSFVIVTSIILIIGMVGWRLVSTIVVRRRLTTARSE